MRTTWVISSILWLLLSQAAGAIPIPDRYDGADAWPVVKKIAQHYQDDLLLIVHPFPLPYHHNAFFACRALHIINNLNSTLTYPLLELFFENQNSFSTSQTLEEAPSSVIERIIELTVDNFKELVFSDFESQFTAGFSDSRMDLITRISFKFGCSRVVVGTPYFFVNVHLESNETLDTTLSLHFRIIIVATA
ncbi:hypothetical protein GOP47_0003910 [Adiantum capillus-veneris]|uniref:Uncharacterized protein n=1 Tax=Adiantum capillus-veneris TaxID=13818 RepID=A0A9D4V881_ADICA|nr:hypothetical protein GOP47_0003910 [Adiantum capillus-veneris]